MIALTSHTIQCILNTNDRILEAKLSWSRTSATFC